jgi:hypothetical protein
MNLALLIEDSQSAPLAELAALLGARTVHTRDESFEAILYSPQAQGLQPPGFPTHEEFIRANLSQSPIWLIPEAHLGSDVVYRLIPLDEEYPNRLRAVWPLRLSPAVKELKQLLESPEFGHTLHLQMERVLAVGTRLSISDIEAAWLQDADLLRSLCGGEYRQVTAIHSGLSDQGVSTASVSLAGQGVPDAMWALRTGPTARCELTVTTVAGAAVLAWGESGSPMLTVNCKEVSLISRIRKSSAVSGGEAQKREGEAPAEPHPQVEGPPAHAARQEPRPPEGRGEPNNASLPEGVTAWTDAVRAFDLLDAARRSLKRRRTVELQFESTSERSQFKTHMTTIGCGLLLFTMFGLIGMLFAGRMFDPRDAQQKQSEVAGFVLRETDFEGATLNSFGRETFDEIIESYARRNATILIEGDSEADPVAQSRRGTVVKALEEARLPAAETRTLVRPLHGKWFKQLMVAAWVLLFLPLGIFLGFQLLLTVTPEDRTPGRRSP